MARIRNIKPQFFKDSDLFDAERASGLPLRIAYAGLWTVADRAGRFKWKPREIKTDTLPYDDVDMGAVMDALSKFGFIFKYKSGGQEYGFIPNFEKHQFINKNESASQLPDPAMNIIEYFSPNSEPSLSHSAPENYEVLLDTDTDGLTQTQTQSCAPQAAPPKPVVLKATRWGSDQEIPDDWFASVKDQFRTLGRDPPDLRLEAAKFKNYWASKSGKDATKTDWKKTFSNWCLNARTDKHNSLSKPGFDALREGARRAAGLDAGSGQGVEAAPDNLIRLAIPAGNAGGS